MPHSRILCISAESGTNLTPLVQRTRSLLDAMDAREEAEAKQAKQEKKNARAAAQAARMAGVPFDAGAAKPVDTPGS